MKLEAGTLRLAATDLANHLACRHLTVLDRGRAEGRWKSPAWRRPDAEILAERGLEHERAFLAHLEAQGKHVTRLDGHGDDTRAREETIAAMREGADVIAQATLLHGRWLGRADVLQRIERPSRLGAWSYEALDTKLARDTKAGAILQLCLYSDLLGEIQGARPETMYVVPRRPGFPLEPYRVDDYLAYYRLVRRRLEAAIEGDEIGPGADAAAGTGACGSTYPEPVPHCEVCRWWPSCDRRRRRDDHLSLVAGISRLQTRELQSRDVATLAALAAVPLPIAWKPSRGAKEGYARVREQARIQLAGRVDGRNLHELLLIAPGLGFALLPAPSSGDLFLDFEGDPYVDEGGLEYLFGWAVADPVPAGTLALEARPPAYHARWALDRASERRAFEELIDTIDDRLAADPDMHVYHYGAYEEATIKRLMCRYATREAEVDRLLRGGRLVDLHTIVKQSLRASVEEYSIKKLEPLYGFDRAQPLDEANAALRVIQRCLELGAPVASGGQEARIVEAYNRDDCLSARALRDWLEALRGEAIAGGAEIQRPVFKEVEPREETKERDRRARELATRLLAGVPEDGRTEEQQALWVLANLLEWHRREEKTTWWEYFRLSELSDEDLLDEVAALSGLEFVERFRPTGRGRAPTDRYRFPAQETRIREDALLHTPMPDGHEYGDVIAIDPVAGTIDIKRRLDGVDSHATSLFSHKFFGSKEQFESLMRLGEWVTEHGIDARGPYRAARDLLLRRPPRLAGRSGGPLEQAGEGGVRAARRLALQLDQGTLAIQGPPGAGKTWTGAHMICDLVHAGKRVGVCAQSHRVIANLMKDALEAAGREGLNLTCLRKAGVNDQAAAPGIPEAQNNKEVFTAIRAGRVQMFGGTAFLWSLEQMFEAVDVLFVDEAGQMSLANVLAIAQGAKSVVLLGDPQQLEQPVQGAHPEGTDVSALQHVLGKAKTIADDRGLFLGETWRLHPDICALTSELFYEGRLGSHAGLERQALVGDTPFAGSGLWFVPAGHDANQSASPEEVEIVAGLVAGMTKDGVRWRDDKGIEHPLTPGDILVIAPYNAQVSDLGRRIPGVRVGTVDRFQGQQAPVVIYSLATSTPQDAPRGMDFLYNANRFNVATSRAKCACIVVGSPRLFEPDCQSPRQMKLANAFCRFLELAREVRPDPAAHSLAPAAG